MFSLIKYVSNYSNLQEHNMLKFAAHANISTSANYSNAICKVVKRDGFNKMFVLTFLLKLF